MFFSIRLYKDAAKVVFYFDICKKNALEGAFFCLKFKGEEESKNKEDQ